MALAGALPSLPALQTLYLHTNEGMGSEAAVALATAVPSCLRELAVGGTYASGQPFLDAQAQAKLRALRRDGPDGLHIHIL